MNDWHDFISRCLGAASTIQTNCQHSISKSPKPVSTNMATNNSEELKKTKRTRKNAPIKFPCGNCNKTTSGCAALMCSICEMWHHTECLPGMSNEGYQLMVSMKETMGYSFFLCGKCEKVHKKTWQAVNNLGQ